MEIRKVTTKADLRQFINLPYRLYKDDPMWVPPLRSDQRGQFDPQKNPMLGHCEYDLFLLVDGAQVVGRISAFIDQLALKHWGEKIGLFGSYECIDDRRGSELLLGAARDWLHERGMTAMRGPWSFASQEWGLVLEGFEPPPVVLAPYNPPYYNDQLTAFGFAKVKDLIVYIADLKAGYRIPDRYLTLTDKVQKRYGITVRPVDMKRLDEEVAIIVQLINTSLSYNWGFYPVTEVEAEAIARDLKLILNPEVVLIAEGPEGDPIGFSMPLPDINVILRTMKGRLLPFGWLKLMRGLPRLRQYRLWALGVVAEYHGKGIDALMYRRTYEALEDIEVRMEINYVLEDNVPMNNALRKLGVETLRRYRVYEQGI